MKQSLLKLCLFLFLSIPVPFLSVYSQNITGIWKGYFRTSSGEQYKLEFQVLNKDAYTATGVSYSYLDVRFYGKATMTGSFIRSSGKLRIREIRTVEVKNVMGGGTCIMNYNLVYSKSGNEEYLEGSFLGKNERPLKSDTSFWGDCGDGVVFLRKVQESDFYLEPFLRNRATPTNPPVVKKDLPKTNNPATKSPTTSKPSTPKPKTSNPTVKKPVETPKEKIDPVEKVEVPVTKEPIEKKTVNIPTPNVLKTRENELVKTIIVTDENVVVKIYDNGIIDDDTISVYLDKKLVLSQKRLTASALVVKLKMDEENPDHELVMVAENLGKIPPNTSLMVVESGDQKMDVRITSTEQKNAMIRFRYQKPK
jgi:hypothetical protein